MTPSLAGPFFVILHPRWQGKPTRVRTNVYSSFQASPLLAGLVQLVGPCACLRSLPLVRVRVDENVPDVETSVHVPIPQACTARCETTAYGVNRLAPLVQHRMEHLVALRARLGRVVIVHLPELNPCCTTRSRPNVYPLLDFPTGVFSPGRRIDLCTGNRRLRTQQLRPSCHSHSPWRSIPSTMPPRTFCRVPYCLKRIARILLDVAHL